MDTQHQRLCKKCGAEVTYMVISQAGDSRTVVQFVGNEVSLPGISHKVPATTDTCPDCGQTLSLKSTKRK